MKIKEEQVKSYFKKKGVNMKNYIVGYALLVMASTALVQASAELRWSEPKELPGGQYGADDAHLAVKNNFTKEVYVAIAEIKSNKAHVISTIATVAANGGETDYQFTFPTNYKGIVLVSQNEASLKAVETEKPSLTALRTTTPDVEFKAIPSNCPGIVLFIVSQGRIGKLRISVDKLEGKCTTKVGRAYDAAKKQAGQAGASIKTQAGEAGDWLSKKGKAAYGGIKSGAKAVKTSAGKASQKIGYKLSAWGESLDPSPVQAVIMED